MNSQYGNGSSRRLSMDELTRMNAPSIPRSISQDEVLKRLAVMNTELTDTFILADRGIAYKAHSRKSPNIVVTAVCIVDKSDTVCKQNSVLLKGGTPRNDDSFIAFRQLNTDSERNQSVFAMRHVNIFRTT